jgi:hypothetical protein
MQATDELNALLSLIDDPDAEVYATVSGRLMDYGKPIIPELENLWENQPDQMVQERIELIIRRLQLAELVDELKNWREVGAEDLLKGALLAGKFEQPNLDFASIAAELESLKKSIWLELNNFLTPLEQAKVMKNILYHHYELKGTLLELSQPDEFFLHNVIRQKKGNILTNGILYQYLCHELNIKTALIDISGMYLLAFYSSDYTLDSSNRPHREAIQFFVDPLIGQPLSHQDIDRYLQRMNRIPEPSYFFPLSNLEIIQLLFHEAAVCFRKNTNDHQKAEELNILAHQLYLADCAAKKNIHD